MKKQIRLYNVMFPVWFFFFYPTVLWLLILPINFIIDSAVVLLCGKRLGMDKPARTSLWKSSILRVWLIGFFSDAVGALLIFGLTLLWESLRLPGNLYLFPGTTLISLPGVALAGVLIYLLNKKFSFTRCGAGPAAVHRLCLALAVFTAPYAMLIPLYG